MKEPKSPGCNGGVCYCNDKNYCNDRNLADQREECPEYLEHSKWDLRCQKAAEKEEED